MQKLDYINMIIDNIMVYKIQLPSDLEINKLNDHLYKFDEDIVKIVAGFNKIFLEHFLIISKGQSQNEELKEILKKMDLISQMISPIGNLNYLGEHQIEYILNKIGSLSLNEITEQKVSLIADEQLEKEFGSQYDANQVLENHLSSAAFYLINMGYSKKEIEEEFNKVRQDPSKLDALFNLPQKEIYSVPPELQQGNVNQSMPQEISIDQSQETQEAINHHIQSTQQDISEERAQKVDEIIKQIIEHVRDKMTEQYENVFRQIHPDRLNRAFKFLKQTKRKSKRLILLLEWFFCSHLIENIELKVEHWQVSSASAQGSAGVYTAGILFSRYDQIIKDLPNGKLTQVINIARLILQKPSKKAIQKLGQDLTAETGFDEHLYFTD